MPAQSQLGKISRHADCMVWALRKTHGCLGTCNHPASAFDPLQCNRLLIYKSFAAATPSYDGFEGNFYHHVPFL